MEAVTLRNGRPYTVCGTCHGSDAPEHNLCPECFGGGWAPVFEPARFFFARTSYQSDGHGCVEGNTEGTGPARASKSFANKFAGKCDTCGQWVEAGAGKCARDGQRWIVLHNGECPAAVVKAAAAPAAATGLDLSSVPSGTYAVPGGDTRLKVQIDNVTTGKWAGWVFVKDGAEYGQSQRYGSQRPGSLYSGKIEEALRTIAADPKAAAAAYGHITGRCGRCNRMLEDEQSVARGIGPVCWGKF